MSGGVYFLFTPSLFIEVPVPSYRKMSSYVHTCIRGIDFNWNLELFRFLFLLIFFSTPLVNVNPTMLVSHDQEITPP